MDDNWWQLVRDWIAQNERLLGWMAFASGVTFVASVLITPWLVAMIPEGYFVGERGRWSSRWYAPVVRVLKNVLGGVFIATGIALLVLPGQGLLTMLIGVLLLDFPGKRQLELWILRRPRILRTANWLRQRMHRPPLKVPDGLHEHL